jgi:essential nuclear protein 1
MAGKKRKSSEKQPKGSRLPLGADADAVADAGKRRRSGAAKRHQAEEEASVPSSISAKILREALKQQQQEEGLAESREQLTSSDASPSVDAAAPSTSSFVPVPVDDDDDEEDVDEFDGFDAQSEYDGGVVRALASSSQ